MDERQGLRSRMSVTSMGNLIKLCRFHHRLLHCGFYNIDMSGDEQNPEFVFNLQNGREL